MRSKKPMPGLFRMAPRLRYYSKTIFLKLPQLTFCFEESESCSMCPDRAAAPFLFLSISFVVVILFVGRFPQ